MKTPLLVKIFIDGQNYHNRLKDFRITIGQIDYPAFFDHILDEVRAHRAIHIPQTTGEQPLPIQLLKAEWYAVQDRIIDYYPWNTMKKIHLDKHVQDKESRKWKDIIRYSTEHERFPNRYREIFNCEKRIDDLVKEKAIENIKHTKGKLTNLAKRYKGQGTHYNDQQLDLITMKFSGFLKMKYETRTWEEKGLDTAIACQMIASCLDTKHAQHYDDKHDLVPDYNSDIVVLISSDMDFIEAFKILQTLEVPCYMIHITNKLPEDLNGNHPNCTHLDISENTLRQFIR